MSDKYQQERVEDISLREIFWTFFKINAFTFGGGYTIVPVIRDEFIHKKSLIEEEEMLDIVALAQSGPGPMAINTSILTGYRLRGPKGAIIATIASVLPCLIIITLLYYVYTEVSQNPLIQTIFAVVSGAISAVLVITTYNMAKTALEENKIFGLILMLGAFLASFVFDINTAIIILVCGFLGFSVFTLIEKKEGKE